MKALLTAEEVAEILRVKVDLVIDGMKQGALPHLKVGRNYRMTEDQLEEWIANPKPFRGL